MTDQSESATNQMKVMPEPARFRWGLFGSMSVAVSIMLAEFHGVVNLSSLEFAIVALVAIYLGRIAGYALGAVVQSEDVDFRGEASAE